MPSIVPVTIEVEADAAAALADAGILAGLGRLVSRALRPRPSPSELAQASLTRRPNRPVSARSSAVAAASSTAGGRSRSRRAAGTVQAARSSRDNAPI